MQNPSRGRFWRLRWLFGSGRKRRERAREHGHALLELPGDRLSAEQRERLLLLLDWLDRDVPAVPFPGYRDDVQLVCVEEIEALWDASGLPPTAGGSA